MKKQVYRFKPITVEALWGYEKWLLSAIKGKESVLASSDNSNPILLTDLLHSMKDRLVGKRIWNKYKGEFPLLIKQIHTEDQLSVQVHPTEAIAERINSLNLSSKEVYKDIRPVGTVAKGKSEMWFVLNSNNLQSGKKATLLYGFNRKFEVDANGHSLEFEKILNQTKNDSENRTALIETLTEFHPKKGDYFYIPAGGVHSLGADLDIIEIQQSSETTYRLYDFNRRDKNGKLRELHLDKALMSIDFSIVTSSGEVKNIEKSSCAYLPMVECEHFTTTFIDLSKICLKKAGLDNFFHLNLERLDCFSIITVIEGSGQLSYNKTVEQLNTGDLILIPAEIESVDIYNQNSLKFIETHLPIFTESYRKV